jgi:hypothetical protein
MLDTDPMVIAIHEAGHAVVARALGIKVKAVERTRVRLDILDDYVPMPRQACAVICLSGPWAERRYCGYSPEQCAEQWGTYWASDLRNTERHLREIDSISMARVEELAREYVERRWDWIPQYLARIGSV